VIVAAVGYAGERAQQGEIITFSFRGLSGPETREIQLSCNLSRNILRRNE